MNPRELAISLSRFFIEEGNATLLGGDGVRPAAAVPGFDPQVINDLGFAGLDVSGVGFSQTGNAKTVHLFVPRASAKTLRGLRREVDDVNIVAHKVGPVSINPRNALGRTHRANVYQRNGVMACGSSCAPSCKMMAGTIGAIVRDPAGTMYHLSNNHVFSACNHMEPGMPILSPSPQDGGRNLPAPTALSVHERFIELRSAHPGHVEPCEFDVAIARIHNPALVSSWQGDDTEGYDTPTDIAGLETGLMVKKFGRTTGLTRGFALAEVPALFRVPYNDEHFKATVYFKNIWVIQSQDDEPFALPGDSGSIVVTEDGTQAVGLLFAASSIFGYIMPIQSVLDVLGGFELVANHNV